jgi:hypothetical protein
MRRPLQSAVTIAAAALLLTACVPIPFGPRDAGSRAGDGRDRDSSTPIPSASETASDGRCVDGEARITAPGEYRFDDCASIAIAGNDIEVDARRVEVFEIVGDRNEVDLTSVGTLTVSGNDNDADADELGSLFLNGDRNEIDVDTVIAELTIRGNDNEIDADEVGAVTDEGDRNRVG